MSTINLIIKKVQHKTAPSEVPYKLNFNENSFYLCSEKHKKKKVVLSKEFFFS